MKKKTIIIIIIVAVVAWVLWKRSKDTAGVVVTEGNNLTASPDKTSLDYILTHVNFTSAEREKINAVKTALQTNNVWREQMQAKAAANGRSFDQQLVLSSIWLLYHPEDEWIAGPDGSTTYGWKLQQKVLNL